MENKNKPLEDLDPVSRKTNEEIETDDDGNLLIGGAHTTDPKSVASDGPVSEDIPKGKNSLDNQEQG